MEFVDQTQGIYRPIKMLFKTPMYNQTLQLCWSMPAYKAHIAVLAELLRLQQNKHLPSEVTLEGMTDLLVEESKNTVKMMVWDLKLKKLKEADAKLLLKMVWEVNNSMKMRDTQFEARRLLHSPDTIPPRFINPEIITKAEKYAKILSEKHQQPPRSRLLNPRDVIIEVVPKVLQGFWVPPPGSSFNMPSQCLSTMAVGVTRAVEDHVSSALSSETQQVPFSCLHRDILVLTIQEKVRQPFTEHVLMKMIHCLSTRLLSSIVDAAVREICGLFQPHRKPPVEKNAEKRNNCLPDGIIDSSREIFPVYVPSPQAPPVPNAFHNGLNNSPNQTEERLDPCVSSPPLTSSIEPPDDAHLGECGNDPALTLKEYNSAGTANVVQDDLETSAEHAIQDTVKEDLGEADKQPEQADHPASPPLPAPSTSSETEEQEALSQQQKLCPESASTVLSLPKPASVSAEEELTTARQPGNAEGLFLEPPKRKRRKFKRFLMSLRTTFFCTLPREDED